MDTSPQDSSYGNSSFPPLVPTPPRSRFRAFLFIGLAVLILAAIALLLFFFGKGFWSKPPKGFEGEIIMEAAGGWNTPDGQKVTGVFSYQPATGAIMQVFGPNLKGFTPLAFAPNRDTVIAEKATASSTQLVEVSRKQQSVTRILATQPAENRIILPIASSNDLQYAFVSVPSSKDLPPLMTDNKRLVLFKPTDSPYLRMNPSLDLPEAYKPELHVVSGGKDVVVERGYFQPLAFSPDGKYLLVRSSSEYGLVSLSDPAVVIPISKDPTTLTRDIQVSASWHGGYLVFTNLTTDTAEIMSVVWNARKLVSHGKIPGTFSAAASPQGDILVVDSNVQQITIYPMNSGRLGTPKAYPARLPSGFQILGWSMQ